MSGWGDDVAGGPRPVGPRRIPSGSSARPADALGGPGGGGNGAGMGRDPIRDTFIQFQQQVALYASLTKGVGTHHDNDELRNQLRAQVSVVQEVGARLEGLLNAQLKGVEGMNKAEKDRVRAENKKLSKDYAALRQKFTDTMRQTAARVREVDALAARGGSRAPVGGGEERGGDTLQDSGLQFQLQQEAIDEHILREREEEIMKINQSVVKVNEIFRDLAEIVNAQQEDIDAIATNVESSHEAAKKGLEQVEKAAKYQPGCTLC